MEKPKLRCSRYQSAARSSKNLLNYYQSNFRVCITFTKNAMWSHTPSFITTISGNERPYHCSFAISQKCMIFFEKQYTLPLLYFSKQFSCKKRRSTVTISDFLTNLKRILIKMFSFYVPFCYFCTYLQEYESYGKFYST